MTIIKDDAEYWVEEIDTVVVSGAGAGLKTVDIDLERAGHFMGASSNLTLITSNQYDQYSSVGLQTVAGGTISKGEQISQIRLVIHQLDATSRTLRFITIVHMRR